MATPKYSPEPIDTSAVELPADLKLLTEQLAENAHDLWAATRLGQGWTFGKKRDDEKKKHPCLIPYADLPDSEKVYDRETALGTLRAILALGYEIAPAKARKKSAKPRRRSVG